jgi:hypothetical protein
VEETNALVIRAGRDVQILPDGVDEVVATTGTDIPLLTIATSGVHTTVELAENVLPNFTHVVVPQEDGKGLRDEGTELVEITVGKNDGPVLIGNAEADGVHVDTETFIEVRRADVEEREGQTERSGLGQTQSVLGLLDQFLGESTLAGKLGDGLQQGVGESDDLGALLEPRRSSKLLPDGERSIGREEETNGGHTDLITLLRVASQSDQDGVNLLGGSIDDAVERKDGTGPDGGIIEILGSTDVGQQDGDDLLEAERTESGQSDNLVNRGAAALQFFDEDGEEFVDNNGILLVAKIAQLGSETLGANKVTASRVEEIGQHNQSGLLDGLGRLNSARLVQSNKLLEELSGRGLGEVAQRVDSPDGLGLSDFLLFDQLLDQHDGGVAAGLDDGIDKESHDEGILLLDLLPESAEFLKREHGESTADDGEALQVVRLGVGLVLKVLGDEAESFVDGLLQLLDGNGALQVSLLQTRLLEFSVSGIGILLEFGEDVRQGLVSLGAGRSREFGADGFLLLQIPADSVGVGEGLGLSGERLDQDVVVANQSDESQLGPGTATDVFVESVALHEIGELGLLERAQVAGRLSVVRDGGALATVKVLGLDHFVDGLTLAEGLEGGQVVDLMIVDARNGQAVDGDGGAAVTSDGILQNLESSAVLLLVDGRPINRLNIGTNTRDVQLKLASDGLLVVDNPEGLVLSDFDAIDGSLLVLDDERSAPVFGIGDLVLLTIDLIARNGVDVRFVNLTSNVRIRLVLSVALNVGISQLNDDGILIVTLNDNAALDLNDGILLLQVVNSGHGSSSILVSVLGSGLPTNSETEQTSENQNREA